MGMYESPIKLYMTDIQSQFIKKQEEHILQAVQNIAVGIDREELFRALHYDRDQYRKGYMDAVIEKDLVEVVRCKNCIMSRPLNRNDRLENRYADGCVWCMEHSAGMCEYDFCSYGERRTDET